MDIDKVIFASKVSPSIFKYQIAASLEFLYFLNYGSFLLKMFIKSLEFISELVAVMVKKEQ